MQVEPQVPNGTLRPDMSPAQLRAARAMAKLTVDQLAEASSVSRGSIIRFENERGSMRASGEQALQRALEASGIRFTERGVELAA